MTKSIKDRLWNISTTLATAIIVTLITVSATGSRENKQKDKAKEETQNIEISQKLDRTEFIEYKNVHTTDHRDINVKIDGKVDQTQFDNMAKQINQIYDHLLKKK